MDYRQLIAQSMEELRLKTGVHNRIWNLGESDWSVDQDAGQIVFTAPDGMTATCSVQIIGTFDTVNSTWLWGWDHPSVQPPLAEHAECVRQYGETHSVQELTTRKVSATEDQCWEFTALACKLNEAQGAYRGPAGPTLVFMTFGDPQLTGGSDQPAEPHDLVSDDADEFTADIPPDVRHRVNDFIQALHDWEVAAFEAHEKDGSLSSTELARTTYAALIAEWCPPDVTPQPIAFGGDPKHSRDAEHLVGAAMADDRCRVRTRHTDPRGFVSNFEYHLRCINGQWLFEQLYYLDPYDSEKYEML